MAKNSVRVGGLVFFRKKAKLPIYLGVRAWAEAGRPDNVYIYDSVENLSILNIPICDAVFQLGMYIKAPLRKPRNVNVKGKLYNTGQVKKAEVKEVKEGLHHANAKDHHKFTYS